VHACELACIIDDPQAAAEFLSGLNRIETFRENFQSAGHFAQQAIIISQQHGSRVEEAAAWQALGFSKIADQDHTAGEEAYARSLTLCAELNQGSQCAELRAELAWLAHERGAHRLAQEHLEFLIPNRSPEALESIRQPSICWCCNQVLKAEQSDKV